MYLSYFRDPLGFRIHPQTELFRSSEMGLHIRGYFKVPESSRSNPIRSIPSNPADSIREHSIQSFFSTNQSIQSNNPSNPIRSGQSNPIRLKQCNTGHPTNWLFQSIAAIIPSIQSNNPLLPSLHQSSPTIQSIQSIQLIQYNPNPTQPKPTQSNP